VFIAKRQRRPSVRRDGVALPSRQPCQVWEDSVGDDPLYWSHPIDQAPPRDSRAMSMLVAMFAAVIIDEVPQVVGVAVIAAKHHWITRRGSTAAGSQARDKRICWLVAVVEYAGTTRATGGG
jgi:hypothetical protein